MKATKQQKECLKLAEKGSVKIEAAAGAGKTSTLVMIAEKLKKPSVYLTFNKKMADEAREKFPDWVEVKTTHSLAYSHFGKDISHKLKRPTGKYVNVAGTGLEIANYFRIQDVRCENPDIRLTRASIGLIIKNTVDDFERSDLKNIVPRLVDIEHVLETKYAQMTDRDRELLTKDVVKHARRLWELRTDVESQVLATHNTYLKLFQLSKKKLGYDVIYLDESQDLNDCTIDIANTQTNSTLIAVGDTYQQIYQFNGSVNALSKFNLPCGNLNKSFRFGKSVAAVANSVLRNEFVEGFEKLDTKIYMTGCELPEKNFTYLFRTNIVLVLTVMDYVGKGLKLNLEFDVKDFVNMVWSVIFLKKNDMGKVKHPDIIPYVDWKDFLEAAEDDPTLKRVLTFISGEGWFDIVTMLGNHTNCDDPDITFTTAHKAKGREWDVVVLAEDFKVPEDPAVLYNFSEAERNLLYVAVTRAKKELYVNQLTEMFCSMNVNGSFSKLEKGVDVFYPEKKEREFFEMGCGIPVDNIQLIPLSGSLGLGMIEDAQEHFNKPDLLPVMSDSIDKDLYRCTKKNSNPLVNYFETVAGKYGIGDGYE